MYPPHGEAWRVQNLSAVGDILLEPRRLHCTYASQCLTVTDVGLSITTCNKYPVIQFWSVGEVLGGAFLSVSERPHLPRKSGDSLFIGAQEDHQFTGRVGAKGNASEHLRSLYHTTTKWRRQARPKASRNNSTIGRCWCLHEDDATGAFSKGGTELSFQVARHSTWRVNTLCT